MPSTPFLKLSILVAAPSKKSPTAFGILPISSAAVLAAGTKNPSAFNIRCIGPVTTLRKASAITPTARTRKATISKIASIPVTTPCLNASNLFQAQTKPAATAAIAATIAIMGALRANHSTTCKANCLVRLTTTTVTTPANKAARAVIAALCCVIHSKLSINQLLSFVRTGRRSVPTFSLRSLVVTLRICILPA